MTDILAVRLSSLGDVVLTQPVVSALAGAGHRVAVLTKPEYKALVELFPGVHAVMTDPKHVTAAYPVILDWHGTLRARRWIKQCASGSGPVLRYAKRSGARRLLVHPGGHRMFWNAWSSLGPKESVTQWYAEAARRAGFEIQLDAPKLALSDTLRAEARACLAHAGIQPKASWVAMAPGAKWFTKQWPVEHYAALADRFQKEGRVRTVWIGGPAEQDVLAALQRQVPHSVTLAGQTSLPLLAALLAEAPLLVCNDSGPMHLGVAAGTRVLAFFGPTVREFGFAPAETARVRLFSCELPCRPCSLHGSKACPLGHHACLREISPGEVWEAAHILLQGKK